jgi:hypothetical protein
LYIEKQEIICRTKPNVVFKAFFFEKKALNEAYQPDDEVQILEDVVPKKSSLCLK